MSWLKKLLVCVIYSWQWVITVELVNLCSNQMESSLKKWMYFQLQSISCFMTNTITTLWLWSLIPLRLSSSTSTFWICFQFMPLALLPWPNVPLRELGTAGLAPIPLLNDRWSPEKNAEHKPTKSNGVGVAASELVPVSRPGLLIDIWFFPFAAFGLDS